MRYAIFAAIVAVASIATWTDLRERKIRNWLTIPALVAGIAVHAAAGGAGGLVETLEAILVACGAFAVMWLLRPEAMGFGDVKLAAALGALSGSVETAANSLVWLLFATAVWAVVGAWREIVDWTRDWIRFFAGRTPTVVPLRVRLHGKAMPYGPAIAAAWVAAVALEAVAWR